MSEKVKVTQAQSDWLERYKSEEEIAYAIDIQRFRKRPDSPIVDWSASEVAKALYIGYEVEIKVGDWAKYKNSLGNAWTYGVVKHISVRAVDLDTGKGVHIVSMDRLESCTPEEIKALQERRIWKSIGRGPKEFKVKDVYKLTNYPHISITIRDEEMIDIANQNYDDGEILGFYPAESFISFGGGEE